MLKRDHEKIIKHYQLELSKASNEISRLRKRIVELNDEKAVLGEKLYNAIQFIGDAIADGKIDRPDNWNKFL